jgi:hypothetical protein
MKKVLFMLTVIFTVWSSDATAQRFVFGGGLAVGSEISRDDNLNEKTGLGLNVHGGVNLPLNFSVLANFNYYFPVTPNGFDLTAWQAAADVHYKFLGSDNFGIYALAGLNFSYLKENPIDSYLNEEMHMGFDIGAGVDISIFFAELKYDTGFDQAQASAGVRF